jgi:hypothetical protein
MPIADHYLDLGAAIENLKWRDDAKEKMDSVVEAVEIAWKD